MPTLPTTPNARSNLQEAARGAVACVNVQLPASVVNYDKDNQTATILIAPCFRRRENGEVVPYPMKPIANVPVMFPGAGPYSITWTIKPGDTGLLKFCDRAITEWKATGNPEVEPQDMRRHDVGDGVFLPGLRPTPGALPPEALDDAGMVIRAPDKIVADAPDVRLGSDAATDPVTLESKVRTEMLLLTTAITAAPPTAPGIQAAVVALVAGGWPASMGALQVKGV